MRYLGGKAKVGKAIAAILAPNGRPYYEPFCGALGVMRHIGYGVAADSDPEMIALWKAAQNGWRPPREVSREEYYRVKADTAAPPELRAFVKHACSFGGKAWGGYESVSRKDPSGKMYLFAEGARNEIAKASKRISGVEFVCSDYRALTVPDGATVYCDPPYSGTTGVKGVFDAAEFWMWAGELAKRCEVFVSEYSAPPGWEEAWSRVRSAGVHQHNAQKTRSVERLFKHV